MATGDHDWTAGEQVTAANMDDYLQLQVVQQFATAAARDSALSARKREGMVTYQIDTNTLTVYSGAAWSTIGPAHGALTAWVPAIVQNGAVTSTVTRAVYTRTGRWISGTFNLAVTGTGSASNVVTISLPVTAAGGNADYFSGTGKIYDSSTTFDYMGMIVQNSTTTMKYQIVSTGAASVFLGTSVFTAALASGDVCTGTFGYEAAGDA